MPSLWQEIITQLDPSSLPVEAQISRKEMIENELEHLALAKAKTLFSEYISSGSSLTALKTCYALEEATPLVLLHLIRRRGLRNQLRSGIQQSYGDHTRMLCHCIDRLLMGDADWLWGRVWAPPELDIDDLARRIELLCQIPFDRIFLLQLWLASALHDYGKLFGRRNGLDPEDASAMVMPILRDFISENEIRNVTYLIKNHDAIEYVLTGETPSYAIESKPSGVEQQRRLLDAGLAIIQLCGAASLGEGRIVRAKIEIVDWCLKSETNRAISAQDRLRRLCGSVIEPAHGFRTVISAASGLDVDFSSELQRTLSTTVIRGWPEMRSEIHTHQPKARAESILANSLYEVAKIANDGRICDHIVFEQQAVEKAIAAISSEQSVPSVVSAFISSLDSRIVNLLNGSRALFLE